METKNPNAWYEKTWLVVILCIFLFPVGLYALWQNSSISKGWKIAITIIIAVLVIGALSNNVESEKPAVSTTEVQDQKQNVVDTTATKEETTKWYFEEEVDKMTSKTNKYATIEANEKLTFDFPYNGGSTATLTVRTNDGSTDVYLRVTKGQFNQSYDGGQVRIKFDDNQPNTYSFSPATDGSSDIIFIGSEKAIVAKLKKSKKIIVEAEFYNEGNRQMEFDVEGFKWD